MRKEIEVKARAEDLKLIGRNLEKIGCVLSKPLTQRDIIFVVANYGNFTEFQPGKNILRIRESGGKFLLTLKQPQSNELDCIEHETEIADPDEMKRVLLLMGYQEIVRVNKTRIKTNHNGWEICLDELEGLGSFIEVEKIAEEENAEAIQNELFGFLKTLGIKKENRITHGYDTMVYLKYGRSKPN